jgi:hypothetical protein
MLNDIGINENLANNLFVDLELNKTELERMIKYNMDQKLNHIFNEGEKVEQKRSSNRGNRDIAELNESHIVKESKISEFDHSKNSNTLENNLNSNQNNSANSTTLNTTQQVQTHNLSLMRYTELRSHFDVIRKLAYLPNINSLVSVSEVRINILRYEEKLIRSNLFYIL